ncbi:MAG: hypothetical protein M2R45_01938 [Verrucomicrobia subdivision 3 bacterium]|nr:hypothetical protein [Limisphaerales bacterium]MCS1416196.1 hypothetical protein [Limisphaerales bacterium]
MDIALENGSGVCDTILGPNVTKLTIGLVIIELTGCELLVAMENSFLVAGGDGYRVFEAVSFDESRLTSSARDGGATDSR